jgi:hypothetical protein
VAVDLRGGDDRADLSGLPRRSYPPGSFGGGGVDGGSGRDRIVGSPGTDSLRGGAGGDDIRAGAGNDNVDEGHDPVRPDHIDGGVGIDEVTYFDNGFPLGNAPVTADLANPSAPTGRPGEGDHLAAVERLRSSYGDDVLRVDNGPNTLDGVSGNDTLKGRGGTDVIQGAGGLDHLDAGPGDDIIDAVVGDDDIPPELLPETPVCGDGTDSVARPEPGVLIGPDCEQVGLGGYVGGFAQARPLAVGDGSATFAVPCPRGLLDTLSINRTNAIATCAGAVMVTAVDGTPLGTGSFGPTPAGSAATATVALTAAGQAAFAAPGTNVLVNVRATLTGNPMGQFRTAGTYRVAL